MRHVNFEKDAVFSSERLIYKGISRDDAKNLVRWRSQKDIYEVSGQARPITMSEHLLWFDNYIGNPRELRVIIIDRESGKDIGMVGGIHKNSAVVLSYYIGEIEYRGRGLVSEAICAFMRYTNKSVGPVKFEAHIHPDNTASEACLKKLGFKQKSFDEANIFERTGDGHE